jgi:hypothetical protein
VKLRLLTPDPYGFRTDVLPPPFCAAITGGGSQRCILGVLLIVITNNSLIVSEPSHLAEGGHRLLIRSRLAYVARAWRFHFRGFGQRRTI